MALVAREESSKRSGSAVRLATKAFSYAIATTSNRVDFTETQNDIVSMFAGAREFERQGEQKSRQQRSKVKSGTGPLPTVNTTDLTSLLNLGSIHGNYNQAWPSVYLIPDHRAVYEIITSKLTDGAFMNPGSCDYFVDQLLCIRNEVGFRNAVEGHLQAKCQVIDWDMQDANVGPGPANPCDAVKLGKLVDFVKDSRCADDFRKFVDGKQGATQAMKDLVATYNHQNIGFTKAQADVFRDYVFEFFEGHAEALMPMVFDCRPMKDSKFAEYNVLEATQAPLLTKPVAIVRNRAADPKSMPPSIGNHQLFAAMVRSPVTREIKNVLAANLTNTDTIVFGYYVNPTGSKIQTIIKN